MKTIKFIFSLLVSLMLVVPSWAQDTPTDGYVYAKDIAASKGTTVELPIVLKNTEFPVYSIEFDITLPEGVTLAQNNQGNYLITKVADELKNLYWGVGGNAISENPVQTIRVLLFDFEESGENRLHSISTGEKTILSITLDVAENADLLNKQISISNEVITKAVPTSEIDEYGNQKTLYIGTEPLEDLSAVNSMICLLGDANNDGMVANGDITAILNYLVNIPNTSFNKCAADVNQDGKVLNGDVTALLDLLLNNKK